MKSTQLPIDYLPLMIAVKVPLLHLILTAGLLIFLPLIIPRVKQQVLLNDSSWLPWAALLVALLLPIAYELVSRPVLYNEMRHFLFILPPLAILAGISMDHYWGYLQRSAQWKRLTMAGVITVYLATHLIAMVRLHPYEYVDYNRVVGGVKGASHLFELDYWSTSLRPVYAEMKELIQRNEGEAALHRPWRIRFCGAPEVSLYYIEKEWQPIWIGDTTSPADFEVGSTGHVCPVPQGPLMVEVRREGTLLGYARDLRQK